MTSTEGWCQFQQMSFFSQCKPFLMFIVSIVVTVSQDVCICSDPSDGIQYICAIFLYINHTSIWPLTKNNKPYLPVVWRGIKESLGLCLVHFSWSFPQCLDHKWHTCPWALTKERDIGLCSVGTWSWGAVHSLLASLSSDVRERDRKLMINTFSVSSASAYNKENSSDDYKTLSSNSSI